MSKNTAKRMNRAAKIFASFADRAKRHAAKLDALKIPHIENEDARERFNDIVKRCCEHARKVGEKKQLEFSQTDLPA